MNRNPDPARDPVIVAAVRTPVGKAKKGSLSAVRPETLGAAVITELLHRAGELEPAVLEDLLIGCAFPEGPQGMNIARLIGFKAELPVDIPAETINRFCSSGLQSIAHAAQAIQAGQISAALAGGVESMSMVPMTGFNFSPDPELAENYPEAFTSMGLTAENVAEKYQITREEQDQFALTSHRRAVSAVESGRFDPELVPLTVTVESDRGQKQLRLERDEGPRADTSLEALSGLKPVFKVGGSVTAGNSSQMSDGAAGVIIMSLDKARELDLDPLARVVSYAVRGVPPEIMGIGPVAAVPRALELAGLELGDIQLVELNEAFASQSLAVIRELDLDQEITNVNGGAIALGHPLGCTGAKLTTQCLYELDRRNLEWGLVTMCIGGGMGAAAVLQNLP